MKNKSSEALKLSNEESNRITKESLKTAFLILAGQKLIKDITITELAKKAGVSRTAFYRNYSTINDIATEIGNEMNERFNLAVEAHRDKKNSYQWFYDAFKTIIDNPEIALVLKARPIVDKLLYDNRITNHITENDEKRYLKIAAETAFNKIIIVWYNNGMKESAEEMAKICEEIFAGLYE